MSYNKETGLYEGYIYKIYNDVNDRVYIGQTRTIPKQRFNSHINAAKGGSNCLIHRAIRKYGSEYFHIEEIEKYNKDTQEELQKTLNKREIELIRQYRSLYNESGYNLEKGGVCRDHLKTPVCQYDVHLNYIATYSGITDAAEKLGLTVSAIVNVCKGTNHVASIYTWAYSGEDPKPIDLHNPKIINTLLINIERDKLDEPVLKEELIQNYEENLNFMHKRVIQYNVFGEVIEEFESPYYVIKKFKFEPKILYKKLHTVSEYKRTILKYEDDPFDSKNLPFHLHPVSLWGIDCEYIGRFETIEDCRRYLCAKSDTGIHYFINGKTAYGHIITDYGEKPTPPDLSIFQVVEAIGDDGIVVRKFFHYMDINDWLSRKDCVSMVRKACKENTAYNGYHWRMRQMTMEEIKTEYQNKNLSPRNIIREIK